MKIGGWSGYFESICAANAQRGSRPSSLQKNSWTDAHWRALGKTKKVCKLGPNEYPKRRDDEYSLFW